MKKLLLIFAILISFGASVGLVGVDFTPWSP